MNLIDKLTTYYNDVVMEMKKVTWPSRQELQESTVVVLTVAGVLAVFTFVVDESLNALIKQLLR
ncbi:MAG: preprotein translocase subunit SecE [[Candidatus Thermochlorobacteriaceae] bacterium GBChlB]|jgi:preprotein translocase subunit SecE|nr:MAG: preprotein translocase subunit SecE [[Candidatus Thermochlorobacteriaceae] bacterium GBChlB]